MADILEEKTIDKKAMPTKKKAILIASCAVGALVALMLVILGIDMAKTLSGNNIYPNVYVGDVNVGGMTAEAASVAIKDGFPKYIQDKSVTLTKDGKEHVVYVSSLAPVINADDLGQKALSLGRGKNFIKNYFTVKGLKKGNKQTIPYGMTFDEGILRSEIASFGSSLMESEGIVTFDEDKGEVTIDTDKATSAPDTEETVRLFKEMVASGDYGSLEVSFTDTPDAQQKADLLYNLIAREPVDARMTFEDGNLEFIDEIDGIDVDKAALLEGVKKGGKVTLPFTSVPAQVNRQQLKETAFSVTLASHTTYFNSGIRGRTNNIIKAADKINGYIMMPGDEFSYNGVVGKRTIEAGFDYAGAYSGGRVIQEVGGGICQVSSTLYVAVLYADLKVTKRYNHNLPVSYVPGGMDATVSYGTLDFCFVNNTDKPIMIKATVNGGTLSVSLDGFEKDESKKVEIYTKTLSTKAYSEEIVEDPDVSAPTVTQNGVNGSTVETYKVVYIDGVEQSRKKLHTSTYMPENKIIHVPPEDAPTEDTPVENLPTEDVPVADEGVDDTPIQLIE